MSEGTQAGARAAPDILELAARRLRVLGHPVRLRLIELLVGGARGVGQLAELACLDAHHVSKHLSELHHAELVERRQDGNHAVYSLPEDGLTAKAVGLVCRSARDDRVRQAKRMLGQ